MTFRSRLESARAGTDVALSGDPEACQTRKLLLDAGTSLSRSRSPSKWSSLLLLFALGCADKANHATSVGGGGSHHVLPPATACDTPQTNCPCDTEAEVIDCGRVSRHSEGYTWCSMGERVCEVGRWGECEGDKIAKIPDPPSGQKAQGLGSSGACIDNPCDPYCQVVVDDPIGLDVGDAGLTVADGGLILTPTPPLPSEITLCTGIALDPPTQTLTVTEITQTSGLLGEYFAQRDNGVSEIPAAWVVTATRLDANVNFDWGNGAPGPAGIGTDNFSVRWTGSVNVPTTGNYVFYTRGDDGMRLWIDDVLVINAWWDQGPTQYASAPIALTAGTPADIRYEFFENGGGAVAQLKWSSAAIAEQSIPTTYLSPPGASGEPFLVTPATADLTVSVVPPDCYDAPITAAWSLDKLDRATVDNGSVTLASPISGPIQVTAYVQQFSDTATVNVIVDAVDTLEAPPGSVAIFDADVPTGPDTATILYPYDETVLPLALKPPVLQWEDGADAASAVQVTLAYPATGTPTFSWSKIIAPPSNSRFIYPREVWSLFEKSAKGDSGRISLQRIVGGALKDAVSKTVTFSSSPLRGKIFYTQYGDGNRIMRLDPSADVAAQNAFATDNGCPVCHSMSASGNKFVTADRGWSTNGGVSDVDAAGNLTPLNDFSPRSPYDSGSNDWRGFAWAPLTPDGKYVFAANNIWGNSNQTIVGINDGTNLVSLPVPMLSGGKGVGLQASYYQTNNFTGWAWKRLDGAVNFDWAGSPGGPVPADAFSVSWDGEIEGYFSEAHTFEVETTAGVRLIVGGTTVIDQLGYSGAATLFSGAATLTRGGKTSIQLLAVDKNATTRIILRWSSANVGYGLVPQSMLHPSGGFRGSVVTYQETNGLLRTLTKHEPDLANDWGANIPALGIQQDNFTSTWNALVEAPATGNLQWCVYHDDGVTLSVDGVSKINTAGCCVSDCAPAMAVVAGQKYAINMVHTEGGGGAYAKLRWKMAGFIPTEEDIPSAYVFPPATYVAPVTGLSAVFFDTEDFGGPTFPSNATSPQGYQTYVKNLDFEWGNGRPNRGRGLTSSDTWSARFTGRLQPYCTGVHEFSVLADDGKKLWLNGERILSGTTWNKTEYGAMWLDSTLTYDFKLDYTEGSGGANLFVKWKPACDAGATTYVAIPEANFLPGAGTTLGGYVRSGGDNGNGSSYYAWETPTVAGVAPIHVSGASPGTWGLGSAVMMVPTFAPDASKLVFVDGDSATGAGWRKGLSTFDFNQTDKLFKNRKQIVNHWPYGDVIKWPAFESDSQSVLYQTTTPGDSCCVNNWTKYGYMGPTNYFEDPGQQWSVDTAAAVPVPVRLARLNDGERPEDINKAYQATMLPAASGGYRWAVFTSTRPYGNTLNLAADQEIFSDVNSYAPQLDTWAIQSMLWVSAIDDTVSAGADRSHPSFWLPNQNYKEGSGGYLNERAYWVTEACRPVGSAPANECDVDEDCCGGTATPKTSLCRIDTPVTTPPTRHCVAVPPVGTCIAVGGGCSNTSDCCFGDVCAGNVCVTPPPLPVYHPDNFERIYEAECAPGTLAAWRFFDWQAITPPVGSAIEIYAETADDPADFQTLPKAPTLVTETGVVKLATVTGATVTGWVGQDVGAAFTAAGLPQRKYLLITIRLIPNAKITQSPTLTNWRQSYSCPPGE